MNLFADVPKETVEKFQRYHAENPQVWKEFKRAAFEAWNAGIRKYGAKGIMEQVRWHTAIQTQGSFKVSNNFTAYYARILAQKHPQFKEFFTFKEVRGINGQ